MNKYLFTNLYTNLFTNLFATNLFTNLFTKLFANLFANLYANRWLKFVFYYFFPGDTGSHGNHRKVVDHRQ